MAVFKLNSLRGNVRYIGHTEGRLHAVCPAEGAVHARIGRPRGILRVDP